MEIDSTFVIFDCKPGTDYLMFGGALVLSETLDIITSYGNSDMKRNYGAIHALLNNRMWIVHDRLNYTRLAYECLKIGKPPPSPTSLIDTSLFTSSKTKLGRAAVIFGLGMPKHGSPWDFQENLSAILTCTGIMSKLDVPMKTLNDTVHPMIYYLMQYNDQMTDELRARYFKEAEYPSFNNIVDDLSIMPLVEDVLKKRRDELNKQYIERKKQKEEDRKDDASLVYYKYEEMNDDDDNDVVYYKYEEINDEEEGIRDQDQDDEDD